jgi:long-chain acyl-CoA synthetase
VGGPLCNTEFKLVDVPEMNYTSKDIIDGEHCPRGECCIRGPGVFLGYYKDL